MNEFTKLKLKGEAQDTKDFRTPVSNIIQYKDWYLGYCLEKNFFNTQRILSVSHATGKQFPVDRPFKEMPDLKSLFPYKVVFSRIFQNRGFTQMYVVEK